MSSSRSKRDRKRQNAAAARAAQLEAARQAKRRQTLVRTGILGGFVILVAVILAFVAGSGGDDGDEVSAGDDGTSTTVTTAAGAAAGTGDITCNDKEPETHGNDKTYDEPPPMTIDPAKTYTATMETSCGTMVANLDAANAPKAVNNFVFLARDDFYDGLTWHRVVNDFVIQGGDPKGDGTGGVGYDVAAEPPTDGYELGSLAAAKTGTDPAGTMGSQFFIVTGSRGTSLPNDYARFGILTEGLDVAQKLESFAQDDQTPSRPLYIFDITIDES